MIPAPEPARERPAPPVGSAPGPGESWTVLRLILWSAAYLKEKGVEQGRLDAEHLLAHALGVKRLQLYLQHDRPIAAEELAGFKPLLLRRAAREPLQYIVGRTAFRDLELRTDRRVLVPRPETEILVDVVLEWARGRAGPDRRLTAADVGTGSGCIALSLAVEGPFERVVATDVSPRALELAADNARSAGVEGVVELRAGRLLEPLASERFDVLVSNPPYVPLQERDSLDPEVREWEPAEALFAGPDGLAVIAPLVAGSPDHLKEGGLLALEVGMGQTGIVTGMVESTGAFEGAGVRRDLTGRPRIVVARRRG